MRFATRTAAETEAAAAQLARTRPRDGDVFAAIHLSGDLGAGKTTWVRGFLAACGVTAIVRSPTYTLVELYDLGTMTAVHLDLYRLRNECELEAIGVRDWARPGHLWLIEWPERAAARLPPADLCIALAGGRDAHDITVSAATLLGERWLDRVVLEVSPP